MTTEVGDARQALQQHEYARTVKILPLPPGHALVPSRCGIRNIPPPFTRRPTSPPMSSSLRTMAATNSSFKAVGVLA